MTGDHAPHSPRHGVSSLLVPKAHPRADTTVEVKAAKLPGRLRRQSTAVVAGLSVSLPASWLIEKNILVDAVHQQEFALRRVELKAAESAVARRRRRHKRIGSRVMRRPTIAVRIERVEHTAPVPADELMPRAVPNETRSIAVFNGHVARSHRRCHLARA